MLIKIDRSKFYSAFGDNRICIVCVALIFQRIFTYALMQLIIVQSVPPTKLDIFVFVVEARKFFDDLCIKHNVECPAPRTVARLLDKVCLPYFNSCEAL